MIFLINHGLNFGAKYKLMNVAMMILAPSQKDDIQGSALEKILK